MSQLLSAFFIPCVPPKATSQQKGAFAMPTGGIRFFKKKHVAEAENSLLSLLQPHRPSIPFTGPLRLSVTFLWPWRKSESKKTIASVGAMPIETRPDCSNIVKMLEDSMTTLGFWGDDGQIANLVVRKFYSSTTGLSVTIRTAEAVELNDLVYIVNPGPGTDDAAGGITPAIGVSAATGEVEPKLFP